MSTTPLRLFFLPVTMLWLVLLPGAAAAQVLTGGSQSVVVDLDAIPAVRPVAANAVPPAMAAPPAKKDSDAPVDLSADSLEHDETTRTITASGNVELIQNGYILRAERVSYVTATDTVTASGNVVLSDPNGDTHFADEVTLSDEMKNGFVKGFQSYLADGGHFTAEEGERKGGTLLTMRNASYTPCECETDKDGDPAWQIKAKEVTYDETEHRISYKNAWFEFFGVPVAWTPVLSHPDGKIKQKSGFLSPGLGYDSELGFNVTENYYWALAPNRDLTTGVMLTTRTAPVALGEYRHHFGSAELEVSGSATYTDRLDSVAGLEVDTSEEFRGHLLAEGKWDIDNKWRSGLNLQVASDDQYLREYDFSGEDVLENELYVERFEGRNYAVGRLLAFQDVRVQEQRTDQPGVLPEVIVSFMGEPNQTLGGRWEIEASALELFREGNGQDMTRLSTTAGWERRFTTDFGLVSTARATVRGDAYAVNDRRIDPADPTRDANGFETRVFPQAQVVNSLPLAKPMARAQAVIEPIVAFTAAPNVDASETGIPNEDSQDVQVDASNLFEASRFPGIDGIEDRSRATYGVRTGLYGHQGSFADVFFGQSYNIDEDDNPFPPGSGLNRQESDYVGQVAAAYGDTYGLNYRFQLGSDNMSSVRHELDAYAAWNRIQLDTRYLFAKGLGGTDIFESREQVSLGAGYRLTDHWRVRGRALRDLGEDEGLRKASFGFDYTGCCLSFSANAQRNLTSDVSGDSGTDITFRIGLKGLGEFQEQKDDDWRRNR